MGFRSAIRNLCALFAKALAKPRNFLVSLIVRHHRGRTPRPSTGRVCDEADGTNNAGDPAPGRRERGDPTGLPLGGHRGGGTPGGGTPRAHSPRGAGHFKAGPCAKASTQPHHGGGNARDDGVHAHLRSGRRALSALRKLERPAAASLGLGDAFCGARARSRSRLARGLRGGPLRSWGAYCGTACRG